MAIDKDDPGKMKSTDSDRRRVLKTAAVLSGASFRNAGELLAGVARRLEPEHARRRLLGSPAEFIFEPRE